MTDPNQTILENLHFLSDLPTEDLARLVDLLEERHYPAGSAVFYENSLGDALYIVKEGTLDVIKTFDDETQQVLATIGPGEFFGEMGLIEDKPRSATIKAVSDAILLVITKDEFVHLSQDSPKIFFGMARILSAKLRETNTEMIRHLQKKNEELQKAYNDLKMAQEELVKQEKLAAIGMVTSRIIHDIKNPMTSIRGFAELVARRFPESKAYIDIIIHEVQQTMEMTQELLDYAQGKESKVKIQLISIPTFIDEILEAFQPRFDDMEMIIKTDYQYTGDGLFDPSKMRRVLANLITNARDAMSEGDTLTIRTFRENGYLVLEISDTGMGIPEEIQHNLFEPFVTSGKQHGTGLGLAIAKKVIEEGHGGKIVLESVWQEGTTCRVYLPT